ncbi:hypothetical protein EVAR_91453_1 [Eumeta japonica]|uniref:Uncharacterized protein n=1 Tax=Eumeta variegata TaxID=151549 RepID=A0A4C1WZK2_EUMVA|nr:hypothetical protein EVAR_91453_1 [Eumeta japonica]
MARMSTPRVHEMPHGDRVQLRGDSAGPRIAAGEFVRSERYLFILCEIDARGSEGRVGRSVPLAYPPMRRTAARMLSAYYRLKLHGILLIALMVSSHDSSSLIVTCNTIGSKRLFLFTAVAAVQCADQVGYAASGFFEKSVAMVVSGRRLLVILCVDHVIQNICLQETALEARAARRFRHGGGGGAAREPQGRDLRGAVCQTRRPCGLAAVVGNISLPTKEFRRFREQDGLY